MSEQTYMSKLKPVFKCNEKYKNRFASSSCLLTISVGQEVHEGEKFFSTIHLINEHFKECTILVDDSLQRHSMALESNLPPQDLYEQAVAEGDRWLVRNKAYYSSLTIPYSIIRWDQWIKHSNYETQLDVIKQKYRADNDYKNAINESINEFLYRYKRRPQNNQIKEEYAFNLCLNYLLEECTALCLWIEGRFNFEVYPNKRNAAMSTTHEKFIKPHFPELLNPVAIKFKNRKQLKAQIFSMETDEKILRTPLN